MPSPTLQDLMTKLDLTKEEAEALQADDKRIDHGENLFPLKGEQAKVSKEARQNVTADKDKRKKPLTLTPRKKEPNTDRRALIERLSQGLDNVAVTNPEREFTFTLNGTKYKVVLSAPRN